MMSAQDLVREGYNRIGEFYHERRVARTDDLNREFLDSLRHHFPASGSVLDLGCGGGCPISQYFADNHYQVTGIDISRTMIEIAQRSVPNAMFFVQDIIEADFPESSFDIIVSFFAIIHIPRSHHRDLYEKIYRWLRPGGVILMTLGGVDSPEDVEEDWYGAKMYWSHYDGATNLRLLEDAGFEVIWRNLENRGSDGIHLYVLAGSKKPIVEENLS